MGFFDQIGKKASDTVQSAKDKTSKFSAEMKLKSQLSDKKDRISNLYSEIGKIVYDDACKGINENAEIINKKVNEITKLLEEQNNINIEILKLKGFKICSSCGEQIPAGSDFCPKCGNKIVEVTEKAPDNATQVELIEENNNNEE